MGIRTQHVILAGGLCVRWTMHSAGASQGNEFRMLIECEPGMTTSRVGRITFAMKSCVGMSRAPHT